MADESSKESWRATNALGQILVWVVFCAIAAGTILATLTLLKC